MTPKLRVRLRSGHENDAEELWRLEQELVRAGDGMVLEMEDVADSVEAYRRKLNERLADPFRLLLVGLVQAGSGEVLAGYAEWTQFRPAKIRHCIEIAMGVHPAHQGRGVGRAVLEGLIAAAKQQTPAIRRIELGVIADNTRARALYESVGFQLEGIRRGLVSDEKGERDDCLMALRVRSR